MIPLVESIECSNKTYANEVSIYFNNMNNRECGSTLYVGLTGTCWTLIQSLWVWIHLFFLFLGMTKASNNTKATIKKQGEFALFSLMQVNDFCHSSQFLKHSVRKLLPASIEVAIL